MLASLKQRILRRLADRLDFLAGEARTLPFAQRGEGVRIGQHCRFIRPESIELGSYIYIGPNGFFGGEGGLRIGDNVAIGPHVYIYTTNHRYEEAQYLPFDGQILSEPVAVGSHVWIGGNVVIVPGVTVGEGAVIAAGAVVTREVPRCAVVGGNPAAVLKYRDIIHFDRLVSEGRWYERLEYERLTEPQEAPRHA
jgi:maltose O-acetyltransferase